MLVAPHVSLCNNHSPACPRASYLLEQHQQVGARRLKGHCDGDAAAVAVHRQQLVAHVGGENSKL